MSLTRRRLTSLVAVPLLAACGCDGGGPPPSVSTSNAEGTVKGKVTLAGQPAKGGEVVFDPSNYQRKSASPRTATINEDGTYEIKTLVGQNNVRLGGDAISRQLPIATRRRWNLDVKDGTNTLDLDVPAEPTPTVATPKSRPPKGGGPSRPAPAGGGAEK